MSGSDIVVVGTIARAPNGSRTLRGTRAVTQAQWEAEQNQVSTNPDGGLIGEEIVVTAKVVNEANRQRVYRAAALVIKGIARTRDRIDRATGTTIRIKNRTYSVAKLVEDLNNTEWTVSDGKPVNVKGISNVRRNTTGGKHTVFVNMDGIIGNPNNNDAGGYDEWPDDDLGLMMFILHELAHLSEVGWKFNADSGEAWEKQPSDLRGPDFDDSDLGRNNEKFAWDFAYDASDKLGIDTTRFTVPASERNYEEIDVVDQRVRARR